MLCNMSQIFLNVQPSQVRWIQSKARSVPYLEEFSDSIPRKYSVDGQTDLGLIRDITLTLLPNPSHNISSWGSRSHSRTESKTLAWAQEFLVSELWASAGPILSVQAFSRGKLLRIQARILCTVGYLWASWLIFGSCHKLSSDWLALQICLTPWVLRE